MTTARIMNETEFLARSLDVLQTLERHADAWQSADDVDVEAELAGNVLTLTFENGRQVIVNSQSAMQELWVAAASGGFHYRYDNGRWRDTRGGPDLADALAQICSDAAGRVLAVRV